MLQSETSGRLQPLLDPSSLQTSPETGVTRENPGAEPAFREGTDRGRKSVERRHLNGMIETTRWMMTTAPNQANTQQLREAPRCLSPNVKPFLLRMFHNLCAAQAQDV